MQKLKLEDYKQLKKYFDDANYEGYNSNFVNIMTWDHEYDSYFEVTDNFLVILHKFQNQLLFSMPFCKKEFILEAVDYMISYANSHHFPFKMSQCLPEVKDIIESKYKDNYVYLEDRDNFDYIYEKQKLIDLKGKKMQKRRNHYNSFIKENYNFIYKEIEDEDIDNVMMFLQKWDDEHDNTSSVSSEYLAIMYLLCNREVLNVKTGCIYIDNNLEAFTIASGLNHKTIEIHIEKANKDIRGLYVAIGKYFLENNFEDYEYVNREEDMGLYSLRKSKQSLHPIKFVEKYVIESYNITVDKANSWDEVYIKDLWMKSFPDEDKKSTRFYFQNVFDLDNTYVIRNNGYVIGDLLIKDKKLSYNSKEVSVKFIEGVCINSIYQKRGLMNFLMKTTLNTITDYPVCLQAYIPDIYKSLGFNETYKTFDYSFSSFNDLSTDIVLEEVDNINYLSLYDEYSRNYDGYQIRDDNYYQNYYKNRCQAFKSKINSIILDNKQIGYLDYTLSNTHIEINELICSKEYVLDVIKYLLNKFNKPVNFSYQEALEEYDDKKERCCLMTNYPIENNNKKLLFVEWY